MITTTDALQPAAVWNVAESSKIAYIEVCERAIAGDGPAFAELRRSDGVRCISDNVQLCHARAYWQVCKYLGGSAILDRQRNIEYVDALLSPPDRCFFDQLLLSPTMVRYLARAMVLNRLFDLNGKAIVEIGGGWGGLCAAIHQLYTPSSYTIFDLYETAQAASRFLSHVGIGAVCLAMDHADADSACRGDLLVSDHAFCELDGPGQDHYAARFRHFPRGSLVAPSYLGNDMLHTPMSLIDRIGRYLPRGAELRWGTEDAFYRELAKVHAFPCIEDHYFWKTT